MWHLLVVIATREWMAENTIRKSTPSLVFLCSDHYIPSKVFQRDISSSTIDSKAEHQSSLRGALTLVPSLPSPASLVTRRHLHRTQFQEFGESFRLYHVVQLQADDQFEQKSRPRVRTFLSSLSRKAAELYMS